MKRSIIKVLSLLIVASMLFAFTSCGKTGDGKEEGNDTSGNQDVNVPLESVQIPLPDNINPLTGLEAAYDVSGARPIAVMLNNIYQALPQIGIGKADILFECLAEGGITRLMGVYSEYEKLGIVGSVRSSRPYYIDFAQMFDAVYCHAGGSEDAYAALASRNINNIDGVRGDPLGVYYRDQERIQNGYSYEHTLMTTGEGLVNTISHYGYRTDLRDGYEYPFEFSEWGKENEVGKDKALHVYLPISYYQNVDYIYDEEMSEYLRYQYNGESHIDGETGDQLTFKNIIILFCNTATYDDYGRLAVTTTGNGNGYLISEGKYTKITWSRTSLDGNLTLTDSTSGEKIVINRGKTAINICSAAIENSVEMNAADRVMDDNNS